MDYSSRLILDCMPTIGRSDDDRFPASVSLPIVDALGITVFVRLFLDNIFAAVVTLLVLLSALLVFALLLGDVEAKTYEYGMLRALGMRHSALVQILLMKSTLFSIGGISTGLLCAWLFNLPVCGDRQPGAGKSTGRGVASEMRRRKAGVMSNVTDMCDMSPLLQSPFPLETVPSSRHPLFSFIQKFISSFLVLSLSLPLSSLRLPFRSPTMPLSVRDLLSLVRPFSPRHCSAG
jgi:hypothetical protein